jgi:hypothetical protein
MKIKKYGIVILTEGPVRIEGWQVESEPSDPPDAKPEQLLTALAIDWAKARLTAATNQAIQDAVKERHRQILAGSMPKLVQ